MANARLVIGIVGSPVRRKFTIEVRTFVCELRRPQPIHRFRTRFRADFLQLVADLVDGGVPGNPGPLTVLQFQGIAQTAIAVHQLARRGALGTMRTAIDRAFPARLLADPHTVRHFSQHGATHGAVRADILANGCPNDIRTGGFGFLHARERQCTDCRKAAGNETGTAQEGATIETNARLTTDCRYKTAATRLALCSLDQHGSASLSSDIG